MAAVAIGWQVYSITGNPLDLGLIGLAEFLPLLLLALPAGHLADRLPRRALFAAALVIDGAVALGLLALTIAGPTTVWPFFALAVCTGLASAIGAPASRSLTPTRIPADVLPSAMAVRSTGWQAAIVGDIEDEFDLPDTRVEHVDERTIRIDGTYTIDDFNEDFGTELEHEDYHTIAGLVFGELGRRADVGDEVHCQGLEMRVLEVGGSRIHRVEIEFAEPPGPRTARPGEHEAA
jgi:hypothetical protein